ncbi:hypothetical protein [Spirillospora albida]|uniref:hypothetical protein n=1 Tax=Spirillospora albida TaxID=58123 RepID=UPI00068BF175|nr:hypothetical protein [Spirillospora albida]
MTLATERPHTSAPIPAAAAGVVDELWTLEKRRAHGVLRLAGEGVLHIADGAVVAAESRHTSGAAPGDARDLAALLALFDAAYFLLGSPAEPLFIPGPVRGGGPGVSASTLVHEGERRRAALDAVWASPSADTLPVVPVRRVRRQRVILTGPQAELLLNADGLRTPVRLARDLGRAAFPCLLAVRGLAAAGLIETAAPAEPAAPRAAPPVPTLSDGWAPPDLDLLTRLRTALTELV